MLSKDVDAMASFHGNADKSNLRFMRIYQARSDFLEVVGQDGRARFAPLHSARESLMLKQRAAKAGKVEATTCSTNRTSSSPCVRPSS
ncbi:hypothetical protein LP420_22785 [Massilia sp. B-10]|nr:hypothetical protein LP420_22785 [Massilia sp. B-10]